METCLPATSSVRPQHSSEHLDTLKDLNGIVVKNYSGSGCVLQDIPPTDRFIPENRPERWSQQGNPLQQARLG